MTEQLPEHDDEELANSDRIDRILKNHSAQLANHQKLLADLSRLLEMVRRAQVAHQKVFEDLQRAVAEKAGGKPPDEPVN